MSTCRRDKQGCWRASGRPGVLVAVVRRPKRLGSIAAATDRAAAFSADVEPGKFAVRAVERPTLAPARAGMPSV
jgi:hypothetical protein